VIDAAPQQSYDDLCRLASRATDTEIAGISFLDQDRQRFLAQQNLSKEPLPREASFCAHMICRPQHVTTVEDLSQDERFADNPMATGDPNVRFYAGVPLTTEEGHALGTICAMSKKPRPLTDHQREDLEALSRLVMTKLELRRRSLELRAAKDEAERSNEVLDHFATIVSHELRDPLSQAVSNLDLLDLTLPEDADPDTVELVHEAHQGGQRMRELLVDLLRYAQTTREAPTLDPVDPNRLILEVIEELPIEPGPRPEHVAVDDLPAVEADDSLLRQVFKNLLQNAAKYGPDDGLSIHVRGYATETTCASRSRTTGSGSPRTSKSACSSSSGAPRTSNGARSPASGSRSSSA